MRGAVPISVEQEGRGFTRWDALAVLLTLGLLVFVAEASRHLLQPLSELQQTPVSLDPANLPEYAARTTLRMLVALALSLVFTFSYATFAAKSRRAEVLLVPLLDILQSVPILGFISVTVVFFMSLAPGRVLGAEFAAIFAIFTSQAWNMAFSFYQSLRTVPVELVEASGTFRLSSYDNRGGRPDAAPRAPVGSRRASGFETRPARSPGPGRTSVGGARDRGGLRCDHRGAAGRGAVAVAGGDDPAGAPEPPGPPRAPPPCAEQDAGYRRGAAGRGAVAVAGGDDPAGAPEPPGPPRAPPPCAEQDAGYRADEGSRRAAGWDRPGAGARALGHGGRPRWDAGVRGDGRPDMGACDDEGGGRRAAEWDRPGAGAAGGAPARCQRRDDDPGDHRPDRGEGRAACGAAGRGRADNAPRDVTGSVPPRRSGGASRE